MCGVFTIISKAQTRNQRRKLRRLALALGILNEKRGDHSWGLWSNDFPITKEVGAISRAWKFYQRVNNWNAREGAFIAGHTRWATQGGITKDNAHPFLVGGLTLVHNGIVDVDGYEMAHPVDSGQLAHAIAQEGFASAIAKASGSMGLIITQGESLPRVYRSDQELSWIDIGFGWIVSSAKHHIDQALEDVGIKTKLSDIVSVPEELLQAPWDSAFQPIEAVAKPIHRQVWGGSCGYTGVNNYSGYKGYTGRQSDSSRGAFTWDHKKGDWVPRDVDNEDLGWHSGLQKFISIHDPIWEEDDTHDIDSDTVMCDWCGDEFDMDDAMEVMLARATEKCPDFVKKRDCMCRACVTDAYRLTFQGRNNLRLEELEKELKGILEKDVHTLLDVTQRAEIESEIESIRDRNANIDRALNLRWGTEETQMKKEVTA